MFGIQVVLAEEDHRKLPDLRHVQTFMEGTDIGRSITEAANCDLAVFIQLAGKGQSVCNLNAGADDAGRNNVTRFRLCDMLMHTYALARSCLCTSNCNHT